MWGPLKDEDWSAELKTLFEEEDGKERDTPRGEEGQNSLWGTSIIGLGLGFLRMRERNFVMQVPMYFSKFSIR